MNTFIFNEYEISIDRINQTVLEAIEEAGHFVPSDCRSGKCNFCLLKLTEGQLTESSQYGLSEKQVQKGLFKSCVTKANNSIECNDNIYSNQIVNRG